MPPTHMKCELTDTIPSATIRVMPTRQHLIDEYHAAMQRERDLWLVVKDQGPGTPGFSRALWDECLKAVSVTTASSKALREAFFDAKGGDLP